MGVVELQPTRLLADGLRAHLARRAASAAAAALSFGERPGPLAVPPPSAAPRPGLGALLGGGAALSDALPGRCSSITLKPYPKTLTSLPTLGGAAAGARRAARRRHGAGRIPPGEVRRLNLNPKV